MAPAVSAKQCYALLLMGLSAGTGKRLQAVGIAVASVKLPMFPWAPVWLVAACARNGSGRDFLAMLSRRVASLPPIRKRLQRLGFVLGKRWTETKALQQASEAVDDMSESWQFAEGLLPPSAIATARRAETDFVRLTIGIDDDDDDEDDDDNDDEENGSAAADTSSASKKQNRKDATGNDTHCEHHAERRSTSMRATGNTINLRSSVSDSVPLREASTLQQWMRSLEHEHASVPKRRRSNRRRETDRLSLTQLACFLERHGTHEEAAAAAIDSVRWRQSRDLRGMQCNERMAQLVYLHGAKKRHVRLLVVHLGQAVHDFGEYKTAAAVIARLEDAWDALEAKRNGHLNGRVCIIADCSGLQVWHTALAGLSGLFTSADNNFPLLIHSAEICKLTTFALIAVTRLFRALPEGLQSAISVHTSTWPPRLSDYGRPSELPAAFGGHCKCLHCKTDKRRIKELEAREPRGLANPRVRRHLRRKGVQAVSLPFAWILLWLRTLLLMPIYIASVRIIGLLTGRIPPTSLRHRSSH